MGDELRKQLGTESGLIVLALPSVVSALGEEASIVVEGGQASFVATAGAPMLEFHPADPTKIHSTTTVSRVGDGDAMRVEFSFSKTRVPPTGPPSDHAFELGVHNLQLSLRSGETAVIAAPSASDPSRPTIVLLRPTLLPANP